VSRGSWHRRRGPPPEEPAPGGYRKDPGHEHASQAGRRRYHQRGAGQPGSRRSGLLGEGLQLRRELQDRSGLDDRTFALVKIAALIALDAPPASYLWQVGNAIDAGATPGELLGVLRAVAPQVGLPRIVAAAPELMVALGLALPTGPPGMA
jgi:4-carboxymuconolactone decarboxylase